MELLEIRISPKRFGQSRHFSKKYRIVSSPLNLYYFISAVFPVALNSCSLILVTIAVVLFLYRFVSLPHITEISENVGIERFSKHECFVAHRLRQARKMVWFCRIVSSRLYNFSNRNVISFRGSFIFSIGHRNAGNPNKTVQ